MDAGDDEPPVLLDRAARASRGKRSGFLPGADAYSLPVACSCLRSKSFLFFRITKLLEDEVEQDEAFWNQEALKDVGCSPLVLFFPSSWQKRISAAPAATGGLISFRVLLISDLQFREFLLPCTHKPL
jgi:hypothetical protein